MLKAWAFIISVFWLLVCSCNSNEVSETEPPMPSNKTGEELAKIHCGSCHVFPNPSALPKDIWIKGVLPKMALRLGQGEYMNELMAYSNEEMMKIISSGVYTETPIIAKEDWLKIVAYYSKNAPEKLEVSKSLSKTDLYGFDIKETTISSKEIVMTEFDSLRNDLAISTTLNNWVYSLLPNGIIKDSSRTNSPVVATKYHKQLGKIVLEIGILNPSELAQGRLVAGNRVLIDKLHRPVNFVLADINNDNFDDFVVANFGNLIGSLAWYDGKNLKETILLNEPGARVIHQVDFDKDGKKDFLVLMTQGRERILFFKNMGNGTFESKTLLSFPSYFGSSYFESKDLDKDGDIDFIYTNGDNADLSPVKKPFHGLRIYLNDGKNSFTEKYFYPINGASKVVSEDFDKDGDLDFAVISFFPNEKNQEGFLYFQNQGNFKFEVKSKKRVSNAKWLTLDTGDFDKDGDKDIILGAFNRDLRKKPQIKTVVILENNLKK